MSRKDRIIDELLNAAEVERKISSEALIRLKCATSGAPIEDLGEGKGHTENTWTKAELVAAVKERDHCIGVLSGNLKTLKNEVKMLREKAKRG